MKIHRKISSTTFVIVIIIMLAILLTAIVLAVPFLPNFKLGGQSLDYGDIGALAAVIPGVASIVIASISLASYTRAEDPLRKESIECWQLRNKLLNAIDSITISQVLTEATEDTSFYYLTIGNMKTIFEELLRSRLLNVCHDLESNQLGSARLTGTYIDKQLTEREEFIHKINILVMNLNIAFDRRQQAEPKLMIGYIPIKIGLRALYKNLHRLEDATQIYSLLRGQKSDLVYEEFLTTDWEPQLRRQQANKSEASLPESAPTKENDVS